MRRELSRRPALLIAAAFMIGLAAFEQPVLAAGMPLLVWLCDRRWAKAGVVGFAVLGLLLSPPWAEREPVRRPFEGIAIVQEPPRISRQGQICEVQVGSRFYALRAPSEPALATGDRLRLRGEIRPLRESMLDIGSYRQIVGSIRVEEGGVDVVAPGAAIWRPGVLWRNAFVKYVDETLSPTTAPAVDALCFNVTADLDPDTYESLQRTGTIHIVSASGLHVLIFAAGISALAALLPIPRGWRLTLIFGILAFYAMGAGMRPPVVRAVLMAGLLGVSTLLRREPDLLSAAGISAIVYLVWRPEAVYDIGFQFSFVTVAALGMFLSMRDDPPAAPARRLFFEAKEVARASFVATLASAPLTAYYFGMVSIVSIPANVLIAAALPFLTLTAFFAHGVSYVWPALSMGLMKGMVEPLVGWILWVAETFGSLDFAAISTPAFSAWWLAPVYGVGLLIWRPHARPSP